MQPAQRALQNEVIAWLRAGDAFAEIPTLVETHAALVFLVGDRAYKIKKAIDLGYLDFSTMEQRKAALDRELTLNRRTAPDLYLAIRPVLRDTSGSLSIGGTGETVEWLLEMRRFPERALLSTMADEGTLTDDVVERLARRIAAFHEQEPVVAGYNWSGAVARIASENAGDLRSQSDVLGRDLVAEALMRRERVHLSCMTELGEQSGDIRHCHGDLHLRNIFLDAGEPTLFDCIEFDDFYALIPPLYDLAFLVMDLDARGLSRSANIALNGWWLARGPERWLETMRSLRALPLYLLLRSEIIAKTLAKVPTHLQRAREYLKSGMPSGPAPQCLVAVGGLSGTGKSSLARLICADVGTRPGAIHLRSDQIRKRLQGVADTQRLPAASYTPESSNRVYERMFALASQALCAGHSVIIDAVFAREAERDRAEQIARQAGATFAGLWLEAPTTTLEHRLAGRVGDASDADAAVLRQQVAYDLGNIRWKRIDARPGLTILAKGVREHLDLCNRQTLAY